MKLTKEEIMLLQECIETSIAHHDNYFDLGKLYALVVKLNNMIPQAEDKESSA